MWTESKFGLCIDLKRSHGSYLVDTSGRTYLDFFNQYSTNPLGYNSPVFSSDDFKDYAVMIAKNKVANCEVKTEIAEEFLKEFRRVPGKNYRNFHFACTGGLAVEAAIKVSIEQSSSRKPIVLSHVGNFHGITGLGMMVTHRFNPIDKHINQKISGMFRRVFLKRPTTENELEKYISELEAVKSKYAGNIAAMIVEPIQCTYGDIFAPNEFFQINREFCEDISAMLIHDEIQTGFGTTGQYWYSDKIRCRPDILIFGKKAQISGIMTNLDLDYKQLEVTWDGNLIDMLRCKYIIHAIEKNRLLENISRRGDRLGQFLSGITNSYRGIGGLHAIDLSSSELRDNIVDRLFNLGLLCNPTKSKTIRFRLNLATTEQELEHGIKILDSVLKL
ncbi:MAG: hypothetical protein DRI61_03070 [Chloroflexi bacterium]|nr:MAG: hypothetical protein DRI61_03070 [Chloroflexota bacterium]